MKSSSLVKASEVPQKQCENTIYFLGNNEAPQLDRSTHLPTPALSPPSLPPDFFLYQIYFAINLFRVYHIYDLSQNGFVYSAKTLFDEGRRQCVANRAYYIFNYREPLNVLANLLEGNFPYQFSRMEYWNIL